MAELTKEENEIYLAGQARLRLAKKAQAEGSNVLDERKPEENDAVGFLNKGIASTIGAPVDAVAAGVNLFESERQRGMNALRRLAGQPEEPIESNAVEPFGGSQSTRRGFENVGIHTPDREAQSPIEHIAQVGGEAAAFAIPMAKGMQVLSKAGGTTGRVAGSMNDLLVNAPLQSGLIEGGAVAGQGIGRSVSEEQGYGPGASMAAEVVGGLSGGFAASGPLQRLGIGAVKRAVNPFTDETALNRASARLKQVTDDNPLAVKNIEKNIDTGLHPSAMTEDQGLMAMEQTIAAYDPALGTKMAKQTSDSVNNLMGALRDVSKAGRITDVKKVLAANTKRTKAALEASTEIAGERARKALDDMGDVATEADISRIQRAELQSSLDEATVQEKKLWDLMPKKAKVPTKNVMAEYKRLMRELSDVQKDNMPAKAKQQLGGDMTPEMIPSGVVGTDGKMIMLEGATPTGKLGSITTVNDLDGLYKVLGEVATTAAKDSKNNTARLAGDLRKAILKDMENIKGDKATRAAVGNAREFSKQKNKKFGEGTIGKILGTAKGSTGVHEELTLASGVGQLGLKGDLAAREIATATGQNVKELGAVQEYIKRRFLAHALDDGKISPTKARDFIADNPELMENYPHLRDQFRSARKAEDVSRSVKDRNEALRKKLDQKTVSKTAKILKAPVHDEVNNIFKAPDPEAAMQNIVNAIRRDKTGDATKGLRAGVAEYIVNTIKSGDAQFDVKNRPMFSGAKMKTLLTKESSRNAIAKVFNKKEMADFDKMADTLILLRRQQDMKPTAAKSIIGDSQGYITEKIGSFGGVKLASIVSRHTGGGGSIQIPAMGGEMGRKMVRTLSADKAEQVLIDALTTNPELLKTLYLRPTKANNRLFDLEWRKYLARSGSRLLVEEASEDLDPEDLRQ